MRFNPNLIQLRAGGADVLDGSDIVFQSQPNPIASRTGGRLGWLPALFQSQPNPIARKDDAMPGIADAMFQSQPNPIARLRTKAPDKLLARFNPNLIQLRGSPLMPIS